MNNVYILTVMAMHDFGRTMHRSAHSSDLAARTYAEAVALPECRAKEDEEWCNSFDYSVTCVPFIR